MNSSAIARRLGGVTGAVAVSVLMSLSDHSAATEAVGKYNMRIIGGPAHIALFESGDYQATVQHVEMSPITYSTVFSHAINLCVAYTLAQDFGSAEAACDRAVTLTRRQMRLRYGGKAAKGMLAVALSNRGVLNALLQQKVAASADFTEASKIDRRASPASENLVRLDQGPAMAVATVSP